MDNMETRQTGRDEQPVLEVVDEKDASGLENIRMAQDSIRELDTTDVGTVDTGQTRQAPPTCTTGNHAELIRPEPGICPMESMDDTESSFHEPPGHANDFRIHDSGRTREPQGTQTPSTSRTENLVTEEELIFCAGLPDPSTVQREREESDKWRRRLAQWIEENGEDQSSDEESVAEVGNPITENPVFPDQVTTPVPRLTLPVPDASDSTAVLIPEVVSPPGEPTDPHLQEYFDMFSSDEDDSDSDSSEMADWTIGAVGLPKALPGTNPPQHVESWNTLLNDETAHGRLPGDIGYHEDNPQGCEDYDEWGDHIPPQGSFFDTGELAFHASMRLGKMHSMMFPGEIIPPDPITVGILASAVKNEVTRINAGIPNTRDSTTTRAV